MKENESSFKIQFLGAAGTVTGSKYLVQALEKNILIDCGLFQGQKKLRLLNWGTLPIDVGKIDLVLLTHGHLDHTGYLPKLINKGFSGAIWGTAPTLEIAKIILQDSARIQEEDAVRANEEKFSRHQPAKPLYDTKDVEKTLPHFQPQQLDQWIEIDKEIHCRFNYNGHIIGATFIELKIENKIIVFSGDIGKDNDMLMYPPNKPQHGDIVLIESTYGNRVHKENAKEQLTEIINRAALKNGTIIIPSFAVERTQTLMYLIWKLKENKAIPDIPVYLDSPMGSSVMDVFEKHLSWHKLSSEDCKAIHKQIEIIQTIQETNKLAATEFSKIIIAGSGMASGGRVLTYFAYYINKLSTTVLLAGYQAEGTRGRSLLDGEKEIKIFGKSFSVNASIENIESLSSHADQNGLIDWLSELETKPQKIFIIHGEEDSAKGLKEKLKEVYGWDASIPSLNEIASIKIKNVFLTDNTA